MQESFQKLRYSLARFGQAIFSEVFARFAAIVDEVVIPEACKRVCGGCAEFLEAIPLARIHPAEQFTLVLLAAITEPDYRRIRAAWGDEATLAGVKVLLGSETNVLLPECEIKY